MEMNLYEAIKDRKRYLKEEKVKSWIYQTLKALDYMHRNGIFHRDIKPENILIRNDQIKLVDFGSCKRMFSKPPFTEYISTRWYRAPECILTDGYYNYKIDIWGLGCVFFELLTLRPLFPGDDEIDEINKINAILGSPSQELFEKFKKNSSHINEFNFEFQNGSGIKSFLSHISSSTIDLINKMLTYDPDKRFTAKECLNHECFKDIKEQDLKIPKLSQNNFYRIPILMKSYNDSMTYNKNDDYINVNNNNNINNNQNIYSKTFRTKKEPSNPNLNLKILNYNNNNYNYDYNNILLPIIKSNIIMEESKEDSSSISISKNKIEANFILPKIPQANKMFGLGPFNYRNSNEFKKMKHNISNHSIGLSPPFTQYEKKDKINIRRIINEVKKNYVSPYAKKNIENIIII